MTAPALQRFGAQLVAAMYGGDVEGLELLINELSDADLRELMTAFFVETCQTFRDAPDIMGGMVAEMARNPEQAVSLAREQLAREALED